MRALLLDTHVWLWVVFEERAKMPRDRWQTIESAAERNALAVSEVSFWEIAVKAAKGKLELPPSPREWLKRAGRTPGVGIIQIDRDVMVQSAELDLKTRDPADRMLVATAVRYDLQLATADQVLIDYATGHHLSYLDCSVSRMA